MKDKKTRGVTFLPSNKEFEKGSIGYLFKEELGIGWFLNLPYFIINFVMIIVFISLIMAYFGGNIS